MMDNLDQIGDISDGNLDVVLFPPTQKDGDLTRRILDRENISNQVCGSLDQFCQQAESGAGVLLIAEEHLLSDSDFRIKNFLASQPTWSDIPLLILTLPSGVNNTILQNWQRYSHVTFISRPIRIQSFISTIESRLSDRARQYTVQALLESLDRSGKEFQQLADSMPNIVFGADADGMLTYLNQKTFEYIGTHLDLYGSGWASAVDPQDRERAAHRWQMSIKTGQTYQTEFRVYHKESDQYRWQIVRGLPVHEDGRIVKWFGTCTEIHEQKLIQQKLNDALDDAAAANRAKSEFLANMSHEIRTPMTAVLGYTNLLEADENDPEKLGFLRIIKRNGNFLLEIINDILDLSKIEAGKLEIQREAFAAHQLIHEVHSMMQLRAAENKTSLSMEIEGLVPAQIYSDAQRLRQILVNLVGNAIKFTESGVVRIKAWYEKQRLHIDVIDTGIGMTETQLNQLFQPFHQADASVSRQFGGTGLGLAISQRLAHLLDGEISVESVHGQGSTFRCSIGTGDVSQQPMIQPEGAEDEPKSKQQLPQLVECKVLVVDDRRDVRFLAGHILKRFGAEVSFAENGLEGTRLVEQALSDPACELPDIVFMDMQMPVMDGYEATSTLRKIGFTNPIIALTADAMQGDMDRCLSSGCDAYISKPIDSADLLRTIQKYVAG